MTEPEQVLVNVADLREAISNLIAVVEWKPTTVPEPEWEPTDDMVDKHFVIHGCSLTASRSALKAMHREGLL